MYIKKKDIKALKEILENYNVLTWELVFGKYKNCIEKLETIIENEEEEREKHNEASYKNIKEKRKLDKTYSNKNCYYVKRKFKIKEV